MKMKFSSLLLLILSFCISIKAQNKEVFSDVPTVSYCELVNNAEKYDQQFVRVAATYSRGFESSIFFDKSCENVEVTWAKFIPAYEKNTQSGLVKRFRQLLKGSSQRKTREFELLVVGKFDGKRQVSTLQTKMKTFTFSVGYGHDDAFDYQITVLKIEKVEKLKN
jgi:hypothetical protein